MGLFKKSYHGTSDIVKSEALFSLKKEDEDSQQKRKKRKIEKLRMKKKPTKSYSTKAFSGSMFKKVW